MPVNAIICPESFIAVVCAVVCARTGANGYRVGLVSLKQEEADKVMQ